MKLTKEQLKKLIKEELGSILSEKLTDDEKEEKKDLEDKLKKLDHKWMKEGKLSSALMERYGIERKDSVGKVLWHSLSESGNIGVYDMKFGNTIIRNLTEADLTEKKTPKHKRDDKHGVQEENDPARGKEK